MHTRKGAGSAWASTHLKNTDSKNLAARGISALKWNVYGNAVRSAAQFFIGVLLARILGPEPFGLVAIAWLFIGLGNLVADFGLASALVQRSAITNRDIRFVFTVQMLAGVAFTSIVASTASVLAAFFHRPDAAPVLQAMAFFFVLQASGQTAAALLRRSMDFRSIQFASTGSYAVSYILVGLPMAWNDAGVWALVTAQLTQATINSLVLNLRVRHAMRPTPRPDSAGMLAFGSGVLAGNVSSWGISNVDAAIVGRFFGLEELGLYNRTMNLVATPMNACVSALQGVLFAAYSRSQADIPALRRVYLATVGGLAALLVPAFAALAAVPETVIVGIYGEAWAPAAPLLTALALAMPLNVLLALGGPLVLGLGKAKWEAGVQGFSLIVMVVAVWAGANVSFAAVPWAVLGVYIVRCLAVSRLALSLCQASWAQFWRSVSGPLILGLFAAALAMGINALLQDWHQYPALRLGMVILAAGLPSAIVLLMFGRWFLGPETIDLVAASSVRFPQPFAKWVRKWARIT